MPEATCYAGIAVLVTILCEVSRVPQPITLIHWLQMASEVVALSTECQKPGGRPVTFEWQAIMENISKVTSTFVATRKVLHKGNRHIVKETEARSITKVSISLPGSSEQTRRGCGGRDL